MKVWSKDAVYAGVHQGSPVEKHRHLVQQAAVAVLLDFTATHTQVLLMRRSQRSGDPWSGQVSLPGGRRESTDATIVDTARRECREEVGFDLVNNALLVGHLDAVAPILKGMGRPLHVVPIVFEQVQSQSLSLSDEASRAFWLPLERAAQGEYDDTFVYAFGPVRSRFPCWRYDGEIIWGLTYKILSQLLAPIAMASSA